MPVGDRAGTKEISSELLAAIADALAAPGPELLTETSTRLDLAAMSPGRTSGKRPSGAIDSGARTRGLATHGLRNPRTTRQ